MRRLVVAALSLSALLVLAGNAFAQSPSASPSAEPSPSASPVYGTASLCVKVSGQLQPEWTINNLGQAIKDGSVTITGVGSSICDAAVTPTATPQPVGTHQLSVNLALKDPSRRPSITGQLGCHGTGGYSDLTDSTQVTVSDASSKIIAVGTLGSSLRNGPHECDFIGAEITVPDDLDIYQIEVGHRGALSFTHDELEANKWIVFLSIG
jgi:hypothetical protein